jgi:hypothetical protein
VRGFAALFDGAFPHVPQRGGQPQFPTYTYANDTLNFPKARCA